MHIAKHWLIRNFNDEFFNKDYYVSHHSSLHALFPDNRVIHDNIWEDVLTFCVTYDVPKLLGLSPLDIMRGFNMVTYSRLKEAVGEICKRRMDKSKLELESRQSDLLKVNQNRSKSNKK